MRIGCPFFEFDGVCARYVSNLRHLAVRMFRTLQTLSFVMCCVSIAQSCMSPKVGIEHCFAHESVSWFGDCFLYGMDGSAPQWTVANARVSCLPSFVSVWCSSPCIHACGGLCISGFDRSSVSRYPRSISPRLGCVIC